MSQAQNLKIIVAGRINSGKHQFIRSIGEVQIIPVPPPARDTRRYSTVERSRIQVDDDLYLSLHSMASNLSSISSIPRGMHGFLVLVDSIDERSFYEGRALLLYLAHFPSVPFMVVANKQDLEGALSLEQIRHKMRLIDRIRMIGCNATERDSVRNVLLELLYMILE